MIFNDEYNTTSDKVGGGGNFKVLVGGQLKNRTGY
jgi:hypothetical protein